jgi:hypothetical protein
MALRQFILNHKHSPRRLCWLAAPLLAFGCDAEPEDVSTVDSPAVGVALHAAAPLKVVSGCDEHADCDSLTCDTYAAAGRGKCIAANRILYVDAQCDSEANTGTLEDPFCEIGDAVAAAASTGKDVIRVMPGSYRPLITSGALRVFGPAGEGGVARIFEEDSGAVHAMSGADVVVDGFALGGPTHSGLLCESARAVVRRSTLQSDVGSAVRATACELRLDRTAITTRLSAMELNDTSFDITNTFISGSTERSAVVVNGGAGTFRFATVTGNAVETSALGPFDCGTASVRIEDSIVVGNSTYDTGSQFRGACVLDRVVVGDDTTTAAGAIHETPVFGESYQLPLNPENLECCIDRASPGRSVRWDIEGTRRPQGDRADLGAYEVIQ